MKAPAICLALLASPGLWAADATVRPALAYWNSFGGQNADVATAVAVDAAGNSYVTGYTSSSNFPVKNGFQQRLGGTPLRISTDSGKTWATPDIRPGVLSIAGSPKQPGVIYAGTSSGIYRSVDSGRTWSLLPSSPLAQVAAVIVSAGDPALIYAASDRGVLKSQDGGATWATSNHGLENVSYASPDLTASPASPSMLFACFNWGLYRSTDGGANWAALKSAPPYITSVALDPSNPDVVYVGSWGFAVSSSSDGGETWTEQANSSVSSLAGAIAASPTAAYAATGNGVLQSSDGGNSWVPTGLAAAVSVVAVDPNDPQAVYAAGDRLYRSTNGGADWAAILSPAEYTIQTLAVAPTSPPVILAGSGLGQNAFVTKWTPDGKQILYSTYLGGSGFLDYPSGIAVDRDGNAYVTGYTYSSDFPVTAGALQPKLAGSYNAFIAKISPDGSRLIYSTFLGGSGGDSANAITLDAVGNVYITGYAGSTDFPVTANALQPRLKGGCPSLGGSSAPANAFVAKMDVTKSALLYSTYLGGTCSDEGLGIAVDSVGSAYVAGVTISSDFPVTKGAFQENYQYDGNTGFLAKLTPQGDGLVYATFLGSGYSDLARGVAVDAQGAAYVAGSSYGLGATLADANWGTNCTMQYETFGSPLWVGMGGTAYVAKLNPAGSSVVYAKSLGDSIGVGTSVSVDTAGRAWVAGTTGTTAPWFAAGIFAHCGGWPSSSNFPTVHPFQTVGLGFVSQLSADGAALLFSSLMDSASALALDTDGDVFVAGGTNTVGFPKQLLRGKYPPASAVAARIDSAVTSALTIEAPQKINPIQVYYDTAGANDGVVAPGAIIALTGTGLGPGQEIDAQLAPGGSLAASLGGVTVKFDGVPAPLISVQSQKVVCVVPFGTANTAITTLQVENNGALSNAIRVPVRPAAVELLAVLNQDGTANSATSPAASGSVVTIYAAGLGQTNPTAVDGTINGKGNLQTAIVVSISGGNVQPDYAGPAPGQVAGVAQINFHVPQYPPTSYWMDVGWGDPTANGSWQTVPLYIGKQ